MNETKELRIIRLVTDDRIVRMKELRKGDVFRIYEPDLTQIGGEWVVSEDACYSEEDGCFGVVVK